MKQRRGIRSIIIRAGIFLLLGAIVNVAVAWGCAELSTVSFSSGGPVEWLTAADRAWWDAHAPTQFARRGSLEWAGTKAVPLRGFGVVVTSMTGEHHDFGGIYGTELCFQVASGWPQSAFVGELWRMPKASTIQVRNYENVLRSAWAVPEVPTVESGPFVWPRIMPLRPIWPGFAINTVFYAAILWVLFAAPLALRRWRRIRCGLCPACAYPVGASDLCTECGKPIPSPLRGRAREGVERTDGECAPNDNACSTHPLTPSLRGRGDQRPASR